VQVGVLGGINIVEATGEDGDGTPFEGGGVCRAVDAAREARDDD
jgi:hypothetical protein